jgi:ribosomal protein L2
LFLKRFTPSNNGLRHQVKLNHYTLSVKKYKALNIGFKKSSGRDNSGRIVLRSRISYRSNYLLVDFKRRGTTKLAMVVDNTKNSNRNTIVSLIKYSTGGYSYILSALGFISGF